VKNMASRRITTKATTELAMVGNVLNGSRSLLRGEREPLRETDRPKWWSVPSDEKLDRHGPSPFRTGRGEHEKGELTTA
jgi:hypothetical protein